MPYPLIIFGAGASFDCIREEYEEEKVSNGTFWVSKSEYRPPLANDLFAQKFGKFIEKYKNVAGLASRVPHSSVMDFESFLTRVQNEDAPVREEIYKQLVEMRLYLRDLFKEVTYKYFFEANNYRALLEQVKNIGGGIFINFNYDLILEKNIPNIFYGKKVDNYINDSKIKIIKIHGAYDWVNIVNHLPSNHNNDDIILNEAKEIHNQLNNEDTDKNIQVLRHNGENLDTTDEMNAIDTNGNKFYPITVPALAIPINEKRNYICPKSHIDLLEKYLDNVDKVLIIGWKAGDQFIVDLINKRLSRKHITLGIVSPTNAKEIASNFPNFKHKLYNKGFTQFIDDDDFRAFMS